MEREEEGKQRKTQTRRKKKNEKKMTMGSWVEGVRKLTREGLQKTWL